ncbi:MAG: SH3 domain-containing protein, partial [Lachnospiraceae bacterium]|nr:SH3 domain-containing protein [Lachnospiraceae bacterium]
TVLTRLEQKLNGWSKVIYEGKEGYIKSEYLVSLEDGGADEEDVSTTGKFVKVKENVNVRAEANETARKLGLAYQGTKLELIEKLDNGWTKVKYEGQTAYVKSEYVE